METAVRVTIYLNESDRGKHGSLSNQILQFLRQQNVPGAHVCHAIAGFVGREQVHTASLVEAGDDLPVLLTFVDIAERVEHLLPRLRKMAPQRLIIRENVTIVQDISA